MAEKRQSGHFEKQLVAILEDALRRERDAQQYYLNAAKDPSNRSETASMFELLAREEGVHASIIEGRLLENQRRVAVIDWQGALGVDITKTAT